MVIAAHSDAHKAKSAIMLHCTCAQLFGRERQRALSKASLPGTAFPKPLHTGVPKKRFLLLGVERNHLSLPPGDSALDHELVLKARRFCILD
jgi:hypothetical protein